MSEADQRSTQKEDQPLIFNKTQSEHDESMKSEEDARLMMDDFSKIHK